MSQINIKKLSNFIRLAHQNTYANQNTITTAPPSRHNSKDHQFKQDGFIYHDTYFGSRDFMGEEIVYENNTPIWGMNYYGFIYSNETNTKSVYDFLKIALMQECHDIIPTRGPKSYKNYEWLYKNIVEGKLERFVGFEKIYLNNKLVYKANYHGGYIE